MGKSALKSQVNTGTVAELATPSDLRSNAKSAIAQELNKLVADAFVLYFKTKNFHWHVSGPHFNDYHTMFDAQAEQLFASIDPLAERVRKLGERTILGAAHVLDLATIQEDQSDFVPPRLMIESLIKDNRDVVESMRKAHKLCEESDDVATASLLEIYIDEGERRIWFLFETSRAID